MKFEIEIKEVLTRTIIIESNSIQESINQVKEKYYNEEIVLDYSDLAQTSFDIASLENVEQNSDFSNFVLNDAEKMISHLSVKELALIGHGDFLSAIEKFNSSQR